MSDPLPPHVYKIADAAYRQMMSCLLGEDGEGNDDQINQSVLVSGESGAGKTVTTKIIMRYLATVGSSDEDMDLNRLDLKEGVTGKVLESNPILEAFGNACTVRNNNSSRFGKFISMCFNSSGHLMGATIDTYLLEKVRLVSHAPLERSFHCFYQLLAGATEKERESWQLADVSIEEFHYVLQRGTSVHPAGIDDVEDWAAVRHAMTVMGLTEKEIDGVFRVVDNTIPKIE